MNSFFTRELVTIYLVTLTGIMSVGIIAPALPQISSYFSLTPQSLGLLITIYTLPGVFLAIPMGVLADRMGRRRVLVPTLFIFGVSGGSSFFVNEYWMLLTCATTSLRVGKSLPA